MLAASETFMTQLQRAVKTTEVEERECRDNYFKRLGALERARVLANRRFDVIGKVSNAIANAADDGNIHDQVSRILENEVGLSSGNENHRIVLDRFHPVTDAIGAVIDGEGETEDAVALRAIEAFEAWYKERTGQEFFSLRNVHAQKTPRIDF